MQLDNTRRYIIRYRLAKEPIPDEGTRKSGGDCHGYRHAMRHRTRVKLVQRIYNDEHGMRERWNGAVGGINAETR
jgi:hypothetical protein